MVTWRICDLLSWTERYFHGKRLPQPRLDAELLLARALGTTRLDLYVQYRKPVEPAERARFRAMVERRARREPVAYLLGEKEFFSLPFTVSPAVLIPRPETEHVVELGLECLASWPGDQALRALDLGTGSGNLAVALAVHDRRLALDAVDVSAEALAVAAANAERHGVADRVRLLEGDLFAPLGDPAPRYHLIVSNPPYISREEIDELMEDVRRYEPHLGLVDVRAGDGLGFYRSIAPGAARFLVPGGALVVEAGARQAEEVSRILAATGFGKIRRTRDLAGIERVVAGWWDPPRS